MRLELLAPIVVIFGAASAPFLNSYSVVPLTKGEEFIVGLIAVLAIDALIERVKVLNEIRIDVKRIATRNASLQDIFQPRTLLGPLEDRLANAKSIDIAGPSLNAIAKSQHELLLKKAGEGCKIRLLLLSPHNETLMKNSYSLVASITPEEQKGEIISSLDRFVNNNLYLQSGTFQIRTYDYPFPHGILITNSDLPSGELRVEMYIPGRRPNRTPGFTVHKATDPERFDEFAREFNDLWDKAQPYTK
jgi:hypothetical protein